MNLQSFTLRGFLAVLSAAMLLPATTASARDGVRIPPPGEVIREVRGFIHGIGRGIKREAQRVFSDSDREERELPRPRRDYGPAEKWDGDFYPDELDQPGARRQEYGRATPNTRRPDYGPDGWTSEEQLRREEASREAARNYRPSDVPPPSQPRPTPPASRKGTEGFRAPTPPPPSPSSATTPSPAPQKGGVKESPPSTPTPGPSSSASKSATPSTNVQYASPVPGKKGLVYPPGVEQKPENMVDVGDFQRGQLVRNPRTGELFRVP